jgi:Na+/H+ antiporter NhaD/arsenite permease-like protein
MNFLLTASHVASAAESAHYVPLYSLIPFILMLGSIAVLPLVAHHWWESNKNKLIVALVLGLITIGWIIFQNITHGLDGHVIHELNHELKHAVLYDYIPFIALLGSLFVITGGILVQGDIQSKPIVNTTMLGIGAVLASLMGTTGAAMLMIRPLISTNKERKYKVHTILFFIATVANCGGLLTPLGDPPLFMMYLRGAEFFWFASLLPEWLFTNILILVIYFIVDNIMWKKETPEAKEWDRTNIEPITIKGKINFIYLIILVLAVAFINPGTFDFIKSGHPTSYIRDAVLVLMAILSLATTKQVVRAKNQFNWEPIGEVAFLFIGIFITMVPALLYLNINASSLGMNDPQKVYYATGILSGFLDNTPTAVTFYNVVKGLSLTDGTLIAGIPEIFMQAICLASVMFGSLTYIGNGPNFMVKAIAESQGIKMPSFFGYMIRFSIPVLVPIFILLQLIFLP